LLLRGADQLAHPPLLTRIAVFSFPLHFVWSVAAIVSVVVRFVRSEGEGRQQLKWITYGVVIVGVDLVVSSLHTLPAIVDAVMIIPLAVAIAIAILKYRLYDIDVVI